ncbi:hypothetical protein SAY86_019745 [Trapa natans]|uniref:glycerol-3-phosphate 1-O-acyltransferase n=1 Tax=Trapa natans TaxID=22666 RepID=A0AAN7LLG3_TRANT|nr:hypothetical protein SAY86_019745 [Trapa natans]
MALKTTIIKARLYYLIIYLSKMSQANITRETESEDDIELSIEGAGAQPPPFPTLKTEHAPAILYSPPPLSSFPPIAYLHVSLITIHLYRKSLTHRKISFASSFRPFLPSFLRPSPSFKSMMIYYPIPQSSSPPLSFIHPLTAFISPKIFFTFLSPPIASPTIMLSSSNLSSSPPHAFLFSSTSRSFARVSFYHPSRSLSSQFLGSVSSFSPWISPARSAGVARRSACPCVLFSFRVKGMAELIQDKDASIVASDSSDDPDKSNKEVRHSRTFLDARSEEELLSGIRKETQLGTLAPNMAAAMEELFDNYKKAVSKSRIPNADAVVISNMSALLDRVLLDIEEPFVFPPYHKVMRKPFDYYMFGQNYIRPLIDFRNSYVGNISIFNDIQEKLQQGHNVVLISNHQTEADPAVIALLLEFTHPYIAENMTYVAGDRVVTDPFCKPFSMGRNLICVYSKKHMFDVPELTEMRRRANTRSLKEMAVLLRSGSQIVWIAPSGGRDRPDPLTGEWRPAPFDSSSVDNMRRLVEHSGVTGHIYPLALSCYDIMPPPPLVEKEIGEKRIISFCGAGLSIAPGFNFSDVVASSMNPEEAKDVYCQALFNSVNDQYDVLRCAIHGQQGFRASTPTILLSQPWD